MIQKSAGDMTSDTLTILNTYALTGSADAFRSAISALAERVEREGHHGVQAYRFFVNEAAGTARAVIEFDSSEAWVGHRDKAMDWPEYSALNAVAELEEVTFLGTLSLEISDWMKASGLTADIRAGFEYAAGFHRQAPSHFAPARPL
ncbi:MULTISPECIES: hypothetical protein [unclassified Marinovum]